MEIKNLVKRGGQDAAVRSLAKEIVNSRKAVSRLYEAKAHINSVSLQMRTMSAQASLNKAFQSSGETMKSMNKLMNMAETQNAMRELGMEMQRAGFIQEMMDDAMDDVLEVPESEIDEEVSKVITELLPSAPLANPKATAENGRELFKAGMGIEEEDPEITALEQRLKQLS